MNGSMTQLPVCPGNDTLVALAAGKLPPSDIVAVEAHVDSCTTCRAAVNTLLAAGSGERPRVLGRYRLDSLLGQGAMGVVWRAWDPMLERALAIKLLKPEIGEHGQARLMREARGLAKLQHPNVVAVHDIGIYGDEVFIATELVDGEPLDRWQTSHGPAEIIAAYAQAARGLAATHALGLVHRDVKPNNILVGSDGRVRVGDFGLVTIDRALAATGVAGTPDGQLTMAGMVVGTPAYMAPEQRRGEVVDGRADQFGLCMGLAEALLGVRPPPGVSADTLRKQSLVSAPWDAIARGLAREAADRFPDMSTLARELEAASVTEVIPAAGRRSGRLRLVAPMIAVGLLAVAAIAVVATRDHRDPVAVVTPVPPPPVAVTPPPPVAVAPPPPVAVTPPAPVAVPPPAPPGPKSVVATITPKHAAWAPRPTAPSPAGVHVPAAPELDVIIHTPPSAPTATAPSPPGTLPAALELKHLANATAMGQMRQPCQHWDQEVRALLGRADLAPDDRSGRVLGGIVYEVAQCYGDHSDPSECAPAVAILRDAIHAGVTVPVGELVTHCEGTWTTAPGVVWKFAEIQSPAPGVPVCDQFAALANSLGHCARLPQLTRDSEQFKYDRDARATAALSTGREARCAALVTEVNRMKDTFECW